jgi:hypothetical protein
MLDTVIGFALTGNTPGYIAVRKTPKKLPGHNLLTWSREGMGKLSEDIEMYPTSKELAESALQT